MAGGNLKPSPSSSHHRKFTTASTSTSTTPSTDPKHKNSNSSKPPPPSKPKPNPNLTRPTTQPNPKPDPTHSNLPPFPFPDPPPPPSYGFHMLDRRTAVLADGSVRSYFALPQDYQEFPPFQIPPPDFPPSFDRQQFPMSPDFRGEFRPPGNEISMKRKYVDEERQRQQLFQFGNGGPGLGLGLGQSSGGFRGGEDLRGGKVMRVGEGGNGGRGKYSEVDQGELKKAFLHFVKVIFENGHQKKKYLEDGRHGPLHCLACQRSSKDFPDMHVLVMHAYNPESADSLVDHLGFHKALCVLMGWNFLMPPDISKLYQKLPPGQATAHQDDLILWPPSVIIHNTITGRGRDGRVEGMGNRTMDNKLRDLGFPSGKSKALYSREGHLGITLVRFAGDDSGMKEAMQLAGYFEKDGRGRRGWAQVPSSSASKDGEGNPHLVKVDPKTGEKNRILYGYLATVMDIDTVDFETRKKITVESRSDRR